MQLTKHTLRFLMGLSLWAVSATASANPDLDYCFITVGQYYQVSPALLKAIALTESSLNPAALNYANRNGSVDVGLMQINSIWFEQLQKHGIKPPDLLQPCTNVYVGGWVLRQAINKHGNTWQAVAVYHTGSVTTKNAERRAWYIGKVQASLAKLVEQEQRQRRLATAR